MLVASRMEERIFTDTDTRTFSCDASRYAGAKHILKKSTTCASHNNGGRRRLLVRDCKRHSHHQQPPPTQSRLTWVVQCASSRNKGQHQGLVRKQGASTRKSPKARMETHPWLLQTPLLELIKLHPIPLQVPKCTLHGHCGLRIHQVLRLVV